MLGPLQHLEIVGEVNVTQGGDTVRQIIPLHNVPGQRLLPQVGTALHRPAGKARRYENPLISRFEASVPVAVAVHNSEVPLGDAALAEVERKAWASAVPSSEDCFARFIL